MGKASDLLFDDADRRGVWVRATFVSGFLDEQLCGRCGERRIFAGEYDAYLCPACNEWCEDACSDDACAFCRHRPERPLPDESETTEASYAAALRELWPTASTSGAFALRLVDEAVSLFPTSSRLWCMRGDLVQLASDGKTYT